LHYDEFWHHPKATEWIGKVLKWRKTESSGAPSVVVKVARKLIGRGPIAIHMIKAMAGNFVTGCHAGRQIVEAADPAGSTIGISQTEGGVVGSGETFARQDAATQIERGAWIIIEGKRDYRMSEAERHGLTTDQSSGKLTKQVMG
jgi:hypothetical protein